MRRRIISLLAVVLLAAGGCGDDDEEPTSTTALPSGATGAADSSGGESYDITAEEFVATTDKESILEDFEADNPECEGAIDEGFLVDISVRATDLPPDAPIADEILDACTP